MSKRGFLSRWSQRKLEAEKQPTPEAVLPEPEEEHPEQALVVNEEVEQEEFVDEELVAQLPDIETLDSQSDFSGFMKEGVPKQLRKLALRKLWGSDPIFANLDGLNDYDEDFKTIVPLAEGVAEELKKLMEENRRSVQEDIEDIEDIEDEEAEIDASTNDLENSNVQEENVNLEKENEEIDSKKESLESIDYQGVSAEKDAIVE